MEVFTEISLLLIIATVVSIIMRKLKQPLLIGYIFTGLLVGPAILNLIPNGNTLEVFSKFGTALLLFIIGLGLNPRIIKEVGKVSAIAGIGQVLFMSLIGFVIVLLFGFDVVSSIYISIALAFSSTIIVLKLLADKKELNKLHGKIAIGFLLVQDIIAAIALVIASASGSGNFSLVSVLHMLIKLIALCFAIYVFSRFVIKKSTKFLSKSTEMLFLFALSWGFGVASLTALCGFSIEVGALFAGVMLASMPYAQEISSRLKPLRDFFIVIFFITLGTSLDLAGMQQVLIPTIVLSLFVLIGKPIIVNILIKWLGYTKKTGFKVGATVAQISEFSIIFVLLGSSLGQISKSAVCLVTFVSLITITISTYMISYSSELYNFLAKYFKIYREKNNQIDKDNRQSYSAVLFGYKKGGQDFINLFKELHKKYIVVDYDPETIEILEKNNINHIYGDAQDPELIEEIDIEKAKMVISTITEFETNLFIVKQMTKINPNAIVIVYAETVEQLDELYEQGANYVMMPHHIGSENMSSFIRKKGFDKAEFDKIRQQNVTKIKSQTMC